MGVRVPMTRRGRNVDDRDGNDNEKPKGKYSYYLKLDSRTKASCIYGTRTLH